MKHAPIVIAIAVIFFSSISGADCSLKVATAAGRYLAALEEAKLTKYQNNSACEVLSYEFWNCTEKQKSKLNSAFNLKEVLGNYCQPHLPPAPSVVDKDLFMKGAELYSWRDQGGYVWYALLPGTNRTKGTKELTDSKVSSGYLKHVLKSLPSKTPVLWNNLVGVADKSTLEFSLPDDKTLKKILKSAELVGLQITFGKYQNLEH